MPRLINCVDQSPADEPILDSQAFWVRLPDGTRASDGAGKLLAFRNRENAVAEAQAINAYFREHELEGCAIAIPPEPHEFPVGAAHGRPASGGNNTTAGRACAAPTE